jgi:arylsulfatase A-like enzyme
VSLPSQKRPNIVLVLSDDHSFPWAGDPDATATETGTLDRFAAEGMRFERMFTAVQRRLPPRPGPVLRISPVSAPIKTLPEHLRAAGYYTGIVQRNYHLGGPGHLNGSILEDSHMLKLEGLFNFLGRSREREQTVPMLNRFFDGVPFLSPFFLLISFSGPCPSPDPNRNDELAAILGVLDQRSLTQNTLVIFAGDNDHAFKAPFDDPGLNVQMLIRWPGVVSPGSSNSELVSGEDLPPGLLECAGVPIPGEMPGESFLPVLKGGTGTRKYIFGERLAEGARFSHSSFVRSKRYRLVFSWTYHQTQRVPLIELYDLDNDPAELENLAGRPEVRALQYELVLAPMRSPVRRPPWKPKATRPPWASIPLPWR